ncbi:hypothetical protein M422DRAFT_62134 [Sphaerobolus stellatus SS14]|uniref:Histidinol-phosphatase n=1 Tax=Sphaerobolus stellatus (strain SS14) TaxID=990650 RepID=A0A0C9TBK9_SPHS4|nr:hypothetical protein M422DRAFT_62134 [Sphaerobolus stellatus SS14]
MLFSHHSHSGQFCKHAVGTLEEVVKAAIAKGFKIYGLTEHVPRYRTKNVYPEEQGLPLEHLSQTFDAFVAEAHRLKNLYAGQITLLVGLETEYITHADFAGLDHLLKKYGPLIEYIVGSVHHANDIPIDFDEPAFERALQSFSASISDDHTVLLERLYIAYFDAQFELMQRYKPEGFPEVWARIVRNVDYAVEYGALFELNAAAFRKGWETAYPGSDIVRYIKQHSGHFTASDDSHGGDCAA